MNYSNLPIYIKKSNQSLVIDPVGDNNAIEYSSTSQFPFSIAYDGYGTTDINNIDPEDNPTTLVLPTVYLDVANQLIAFTPASCDKLYISGYSDSAANGFYIPDFNEASGTTQYLRQIFRHETNDFSFSYDILAGVVALSSGRNHIENGDYSNLLIYSVFYEFSIVPWDKWFDSVSVVLPYRLYLSGVKTSAARLVDIINSGPDKYGYCNPNTSYFDQDSAYIPVDDYSFIKNYISGKVYQSIGDGAIEAYPYTFLANEEYQYIAAASVSIDNGSQLAPRRVLGSNIEQKNQFRIGAAPQTRLSFSAYINTLNTYSLTKILDSSGKSPYDIKVGNNVFSNCYLNNYGIDISPFKTSMISADYLVAQPPTGEYITVADSISFTNDFVSGVVFGHTCAISGAEQVVDTIQTSMKYSVNCGRTPSYSLGEINPRVVFLDTVEKQMDITSTNLQSLINYSGYQLGTNLGFTLKDAQNITGAIITMNSGATLLSQQYSTNEGDILVAQVSIKEIVV